jgi:hypothetical protein
MTTVNSNGVLQAGKKAHLDDGFNHIEDFYNYITDAQSTFPSQTLVATDTYLGDDFDALYQAAVSVSGVTGKTFTGYIDFVKESTFANGGNLSLGDFESGLKLLEIYSKFL